MMKESKEPTNQPSSNLSQHPPEEPPHEEIAAKAYALWEKEGKPEGRHLEHWLRARAQCRCTNDLQISQG